jgi:hypothetical protein
MLGTGCPAVPSMDVLSPWSSGWASPPIHPAKWLQRQRPQSPRPRSRTRRLAATKSAHLSAYPLASLAERR